MIVRQYEQSDRESWNEFIESSKNGTFLFDRNYMDYHSNRFKDNSLMIYDSKEKLVAVLPANKRENILLSHGGLTYGGLITNDSLEGVKELLQQWIMMDEEAKQKMSKQASAAFAKYFHIAPAAKNLANAIRSFV